MIYLTAAQDDYDLTLELLEAGADPSVMSRTDNFTAVGIAMLGVRLGALSAFQQFYGDRNNYRRLEELMEEHQGYMSIFGFRIPFTGYGFDDIVAEAGIIRGAASAGQLRDIRTRVQEAAELETGDPLPFSINREVAAVRAGRVAEAARGAGAGARPEGPAPAPGEPAGAALDPGGRGGRGR